MTSSIRTFLLLNLLLSVTLITALTIIGSMFLEHKDLQGHLDMKLTESAFTLNALVSHPLASLEKEIIQKRIDSIPLRQNQYFSAHTQSKLITQYYEYQKMQFQVWDYRGHLLLRSRNSPKDSLIHAKLGLHDMWVNNEPWRVFATYDPETHMKIIVAEEYDFRKILEKRLTQDSIFLMLLTYPLLGLLIWVIVRRGLDSIKKVTYELSNRNTGHLEPVDLKQVPFEIKPLIDELNKLFLRLHQAFEREKRFGADAAHELRTPLAAIKAQVQVALNATQDDVRNEALQKVIAGVDRSTHVVQQLLILSRMVPEASVDYSQPVNLTQQAKEVLVELAPEAVRKNTEIELIAPDNPSMISGNLVAINILIRNLIDNAIRYTPENSHITVAVREEPDTISLIVVDNGPGIPQHLRQRVFERFFRLLGNKSPGSGLGLGIVQQIAEMHNALIELDTPESGQGLQFSVIFPKRKEE